MASIKPLLIVSDQPIIHKPKPKRIFKIQNNMSNHYNELRNNREIKQKISKYKHENENKNKKIKKKKSKRLSFNLDLISLEEIENDFNDFKSKNEEIEVQRELLNLLIKNNNNQRYCINKGKYKRPENPFFKNF